MTDEKKMTNDEALSRLEAAVQKLKHAPDSVEGFMNNAVYAAESAASSIGQCGSKSFTIRTKELLVVEYETKADTQEAAIAALGAGGFVDRKIVGPASRVGFAAQVTAVYENGCNGPKCSDCSTEDGVTIDPDPFESDVNEKYVDVAMCVACRNKSAQEI